MSTDLTGVELTRTLGMRSRRGQTVERAFEMGRLVQQMMLEHPGISLASIRLAITDEGVKVRGTARPDLVCPYCGDPFSPDMQYTGGPHSEHRDVVGYECENWQCYAAWDQSGVLVRPSKLSPGGDDEAQESGTEPPSG